jgi:hypothetical protein
LTSDKLQSVFRFYEQALTQKLAGDNAEAPPFFHEVSWDHLREMCHTAAEEFVPAGRIEKAMRWLGYVQGVLVCRGDFTLDEVKNHSRPDEENPPLPAATTTVYARALLTPLSEWKHVKGGVYIVLGVALCSTNGERDGKEESVVYWSKKYKALRERELSQFLSGRFIPIDHEEKPLAAPEVS